MPEYGLYPVSGELETDCDQCMDVRICTWYVDDEGGGSQWCLCRQCVDYDRKVRQRKQLPATAGERR